MNFAHVLSPDDVVHYGVKGMKWGIRKRRDEAARRKQFSGVAKRQRMLKNRRNLTDDQLDAAISRLQKEKKLKDLLDEDLSPGRTMVKNLIVNGGSQGAQTATSNATNMALTYGIRSALEGGFNRGDAAEYFKPKKKK